MTCSPGHMLDLVASSLPKSSSMASMAKPLEILVLTSLELCLSKHSYLQNNFYSWGHRVSFPQIFEKIMQFMS